MPSPELTLVTGLKNRREHLLSAFSSWVRRDQVTKIIVLDWASDDPVLLTDLKDERVSLYRVESDSTEFPRSVVWNTLFALAPAGVIIKIDCDVLLASDLPSLPEKSQFLLPFPKHFGNEVSYRNAHGNQGSVVLHKEAYLHAQGYSEVLTGWGHEDFNLYRKLTDLGYEQVRTTASFLHIDHPDESRLVHHTRKSFCSVPDEQRSSWNLSMRIPVKVKDVRADVTFEV